MTSATTDESGTNVISGDGRDSGSGLLRRRSRSLVETDTWDMQPARRILLELAGHRTPHTSTLARSGYAVASGPHNEKQALVLVLLTTVARLHRRRREPSSAGRSSTNL